MTAVTGLATATGVAPGLAAAAATFSLGSTAALLLFGGKTGEYSLVDRLKQAKDQTGLIKGEVRKICEKLRNKALERAKEGAETQETENELAVKVLLNGLLAKQTAPGRQAMVKLVCAGAERLFKTFNEKAPELLQAAQSGDIPIASAMKQMQAFHADLCQELSKDIFKGCAKLDTNNAKEELIKKRLSELEERLQNFRITAKEQPTEVATSSAFDQRVEEIFGNAVLAQDVAAKLRGLSEASTREDKLATYHVLQELKGTPIRLEPTDNSPMAQVIRAASYPAGRDIPHFDDLFFQLRDAFGESVNRTSDGKIVIKGDTEKQIILENRHPSLGGKVTVYFGDQKQGGMWNDKVEEMVKAFLKTNRGAEYPSLEPEKSVTERVIGSTKKSSFVAKGIFERIKDDLPQNHFEKIESSKIESCYKIRWGDVWILAERAQEKDSRVWNIKSITGDELVSGVSIKNLKEELERVKRGALAVTAIDLSDEQYAKEVSAPSKLLQQELQKGHSENLDVGGVSPPATSPTSAANEMELGPVGVHTQAATSFAMPSNAKHRAPTPE